MNAFFHMGGYGEFVWPAYAIAALIMFLLWVISLRAQRTSRDELAALNLQGRRRRQDFKDET